MREARYQSDIIAVSCPGRSTLTCAECRDCPNGWTGTETCTGAVACFVSVFAARNTQGVDRGCYFGQLSINHQCNETIRETDGTLIRSFCCNESDFCNENTIVNFSFMSDGTTPPPTTTITTTPAIVTSPITTTATTTDHDGC